MPDNFFPERPDLTPTIYAYAIDDAGHKGQLKVGYTDCDVRTRILEQTKTAQVNFRIVLEESAIRDDGSAFDDHPVHRMLEQRFVRTGANDSAARSRMYGRPSQLSRSVADPPHSARRASACVRSSSVP